MNILDELTIYQATDEQILGELHDRLVRMRRSCCFSQQELSELSGVSIATIKRIETQKDRDLSITVLIRLLRTMTQMEGISRLVPEVPESPFISREDGKRAVRISSKTRRA
ncbi:MAG: helix-turn-helix transcriptional regulator [Bacteroidia bacterium]|nr:helix-turn-helix transcriptional regulator [Bacteroidia bacterium]